jgi:Zn-dependent metalloprotease
MKQILLITCCILFSGFLSGQQKTQQNLENNLKSNSKIESYSMNDDRQSPSMIKLDPSYNLTLENLPGFLRNTLQIDTDAYQLAITDKFKSKSGSEIVTLSATYNGVNLAHAKYKAFVKNNLVKFISLEHYLLDQSINQTASLTKDQARARATQHVGADKYVWDVINEQMAQTFDANALASLQASYVEHFPVGELVYVDNYSTKEADLRLAYKFNIYASEPVYRANVYVDAQSGNVLLADAIIKHANEINEKRAADKSAYTYAAFRGHLATGKTRYAGIRSFETTEQTFTDENDPFGGDTTAYSLDGTINLAPYGIVDDAATPGVDESLVLNETRSYDGVGGVPLAVNGIPSYSIYDGYARPSENQITVTEVADNDWTGAEHYRNDFSLPYAPIPAPGHNEVRNDDVALDAHWGAEIVVRYWADIHGRSSHDNRGTKILNFVHYGDAYDNAFWNGSAMTYGDGSYQGGTHPDGSFAPLTSLDVCGHEIGHGVCSATADLVYARESGAMNEGFSDIWAATAEYYVIANIDSSLPYDPWGIGEQIDERDSGEAPGSATSRALRWMDDPNAEGNPSCYGGADWSEPECGEPTLANDQCGVHNNSGVLNKWFYLLVEGSGQTMTPGLNKTAADTGKTDRGAGYDFSNQGIGFVKAEQITFKAEVLLTPNAKFEEMRRMSILVAEQEYTPFEVEQVTNAWYGVCVGEKFIAPDPDVLFYAPTSATLTNEATSTNGCNEANTLIVSVTAASVTTPQTATFTFGDSTATLGEDFDVSPSSLTFPVSGSSSTQHVIVTVYNDAIIEGLETIQMDFTNGTETRKHTVTIIDDDYAPAIGSGLVELLAETFDTSDKPADWFVNSAFDANTWVFNGTGPSSIGRAYVVPSLAATPEPTYDGTAFSSIHLISKPVDARGITNVNVSFDWEAGGEYDQVVIFDWGEFMYSFDGVTYESVEKFSTPGSPGGLGVNGVGTFDMAMPELDNKTFTLIWRWYNDSILAGQYSFSIDNVLVTGNAAPVESDVADSDSENVTPGNQIYFISDQDGGVIGLIENASTDLGCVTVNIEEAGSSAAFSGINGSHSGKVYKIEADGANASTATYDVTLYYTDAEISDLSPTADLQIIKVNSTDIDAASDREGNYTLAGGVSETNAEREYSAFKGTFTGFSTFALYDRLTLSTPEFETSGFAIYPTLLSNNENITVNSTSTLIESTSIYSISGALIGTQKVNANNASISTANLAAGMYFLVINDTNTFKFIIK